MEALLTLEPTYLWLILAGLCIAIEAMGFSGVGFLFSGLAALITSLIIHLGIIDMENVLMQVAAFFALTTTFALLLWKPLKKWRTNQDSGQEFNNMIGDVAVITQEGLQRGKQGKVSWSGTTMYAEIAESCPTDRLEGGILVEITEVEGNTLIVKPKA